MVIITLVVMDDALKIFLVDHYVDEKMKTTKKGGTNEEERNGRSRLFRVDRINELIFCRNYIHYP